LFPFSILFPKHQNMTSWTLCKVGTPLADIPPTAVAELAVATAVALNLLAMMVLIPLGSSMRSSCFTATPPPAICTTFCFNGAMAKQFYFLAEDTVGKITCPMQATNISNQAVCLANLGDQLNNNHPLSFSLEESGGYFITLVTKATVDMYGLPTSPSNPVTLPLPEGEQPGNVHLHWNPILEPAVDIPCFAALSVACPVLPGNPAFNGLPINCNLDPNAMTLAPMFARWFVGIQHLHQHHHGFFLHAHNTLFTWAELDEECFSNLPLRISPTILLEGIGTLDKHHVNMTAIFKAERLAAFFWFFPAWNVGSWLAAGTYTRSDGQSKRG
jgi:hypothetical protein